MRNSKHRNYFKIKTLLGKEINFDFAIQSSHKRADIAENNQNFLRKKTHPSCKNNNCYSPNLIIKGHRKTDVFLNLKSSFKSSRSNRYQAICSSYPTKLAVQKCWLLNALYPHRERKLTMLISLQRNPKFVSTYVYICSSHVVIS